VATQEFNCPNCGAPLDYTGTGATMRCPYCDTSVVVPTELRPRVVVTPEVEELPEITTRLGETAPASAQRSSCFLIALAAGIVVFLAGLAAVIIFTSRQSDGVSEQSRLATQYPAIAMATATQVPVPTAIPTQSFARLVGTFSSQGIGAGLLNDARYITVDGSGTVYVADYQGGRIQAFDPEGKFLRSWQVGDAKSVIYGLAANQAGTVSASVEGDIYQFEGATGKTLGKVEYAGGAEFGDLTALPDGGFLAAWYEGRWGIITSLEGHRDDLVWFDAEGKTVRTLESAISGQTGDIELDMILAVDGLGNVYVLSEHDNEIFKFTSQGKFIDRIAIEDNKPNQSLLVDCIAVDGQGRIYVGGSNKISIFSPAGQYLLTFEANIGNVWMMAFNPQNGDLYTVSNNSVSRYALGDLPDVSP
jgi:outer membrane protein assembly factor BamB/DNA-directed RNA polymerase subunit RPC12/RpoP